MDYIFYKTTCLVNDKYYYGVHKVLGSIDADTYLGSGVDLQKDIMRYGKDKFVRIIIMSTMDKELCDLAEAHYVRPAELANPLCYNKKLGGDDLNHQGHGNLRDKLTDSRFVEKFHKKRTNLGAVTVNPVDYHRTDSDNCIVHKSEFKKMTDNHLSKVKYNSPKISQEQKELDFVNLKLRKLYSSIKKLLTFIQEEDKKLFNMEVEYKNLLHEKRVWETKVTQLSKNEK